MRQEIETKRRVLANRLPYHEAMQDSVWAQQRRFDPETLEMRAGQRLPRLKQLGFDQGLATAFDLTRSGWETALATEKQPAVALFHFGASLTDLVLRQEEQLALYDSLLTVLPPAES